MALPFPKSVGLIGDGDEIAAIRDIEEAFGVTLDYGDAGTWRTAGDIYASLCRTLPLAGTGESDNWGRFRAALARETGMNPAEIEEASPLLAPPTLRGAIIFWLLMALVASIPFAHLFLR